MNASKFRTGRIVTTANALDHLTQDDILSGLSRHTTGDWGDLDADDRKENDQALERGTRLLSAYQAGNGVKFWIITEANRSVTTVLLPEDY
ncbi:MAG: hypothetical protein WCH99_01705 [Verrucomicrobiota bacterium]